ncbi:MAG: 3-methyl-2-oxobutanoate hydroxymethyltransferase [Desulfopila sp.]|jgi:3-methyl-2-oxobutanoate hydroxymethyltransferase|nr:3-methyl-2-oxobutanoate hydroxymethyltransferase [Desulfopila sp.]
MPQRKTVKEIATMKAGGQRITMLTAYDAAMARLFHSCGVDILLVGDSLGMVMLGYDSTVPVTMDEMLHHCKAVRRGAPGAFIVGDMPFGSYQVEVEEAVRNGIRFLKQGGVDAVKLEGGLEVCPIVAALVRAGVPVMGHIGLTPQTASQMGGYKVQGRDEESALRLLQEARALEEAGAFSLVLECIPDQLAQVLSDSIAIATIGIGAGAGCDGQVLVGHDLLGMFPKFTPSFVKKYADLAPQIEEAVKQYIVEVQGGTFPDEAHSFIVNTDYRAILKKHDG